MTNITPGQVLTSFTGFIANGSNKLVLNSSISTSYRYYQIIVTNGDGTIPDNTLINSFNDTASDALITGPTAGLGNYIQMNKNATASGTATMTFSVVRSEISIQTRDFLKEAESIITNRRFGWN